MGKSLGLAIIVVPICLVAAGCGDSDREAERRHPRDNLVWGEQVRALERAQGAEATLLQGAQSRQEAIEAQTR